MKIAIMTRGRVHVQETIKWIPEKWWDQTFLVCPDNEYDELERLYPGRAFTAPNTVTNYSKKFQYLYDFGLLGAKKVVIMDDDLYFNEYIGKRLCVIKDKERLTEMFDYMEYMLNEIPLVGVHPRMMANNAKRPFEWNSKIVTIQGINRELAPEGLKLDYFPILADVIFNCELLSRGYPNARITTHFVDWLDSQAPGGCDYRTAEMQREATAWIAERFKPYATQVIKRPKTAKWLGDERYDLRVRWKDLYNDSPRKSNLLD